MLKYVFDSTNVKPVHLCVKLFHLPLIVSRVRCSELQGYQPSYTDNPKR